MAPKHEHPPSNRHQWATAVIGVFLLAMAAVIAFVIERPYSLGAIVLLAALVLLGADAVVAAMRRRRALVDRIGPLP